MPPPKCHFTIRGPAPTTIEYKVSTASPPLTLRAQCLQYFILLLRFLLAALILLSISLRFIYVPNVWGSRMMWASNYVRDVSMSWFAALGLVGGGLVTRRWHTGELSHTFYFLRLFCVLCRGGDVDGEWMDIYYALLSCDFFLFLRKPGSEGVCRPLSINWILITWTFAT